MSIGPSNCRSFEFMTRLLLVFLTATLLSSCSNSENLLLGKWKFDRVEKEDDSLNDNTSREIAWSYPGFLDQEYQYMRMEFFSNGECFIYYNMFSNQSNRPYDISDDGKIINTTDEFGQPTQIEIARLDEIELAIRQDGVILVLVRE